MTSETIISHSVRHRSGELTIDQFKRMDQLAISEYSVPIELMMENAGLQLARLVAGMIRPKGSIVIGVGPGNNGGGGLVAARRLAGWGFEVSMEIPHYELKPLPAHQLKRAQASGAILGKDIHPDVYVDAYFGFSQRLPLPERFQEAIKIANTLEAKKVSLDLPSGFNANTGETLFIPDIVLTMAAPKKELRKLNPIPELYVADIGIPVTLYEKLGIPQPAFQLTGYAKYKYLRL